MKIEKFNKKNSIIFGVLTLIWCAFIFSNSNKAAFSSANESNAIKQLILSLIDKIFNLTDNSSNELSNMLSVIIRKGAHFFSFFILFLIFYKFIENFSFSFKENITISLFFSFFYATSDEFHQLFVDGRVGLIQDVLIDGLGIVAALIVIFLIKKINNKNNYLTFFYKFF